MASYYNEFCPTAAAWIRQLIADKQIPYGHVDDRSITEVTPSDLRGFTQAHFFAGLGGWSRALKLAGWPDDRPVWTASLPCQPFSSAGKQAGTDDERHLWPVFQRLVSECRPPVLIGEQVSSKIAREKWFPGVCLDLQAMGYPVTALDLCAPCAGEDGEGRTHRGDIEPIVIGAPHIRQRLYWVAYRGESGRLGDSELHGCVTNQVGRSPCKSEEQSGVQQSEGSSSDHRMADTISEQELSSDPRGLRTELSGGGTTADHRMADTERPRLEGRSGPIGDERGADGQAGSRRGDNWKRVSFAADCLGGDDVELGDECSICGLTYAEDCECPGPTQDGYEYDERDGVLYARWVGDTGGEGSQGLAGNVGDGSEPGRQHQEQARPAWTASWTDFDLIPCRDGKARRVESKSSALAHGLPRGVVPSCDPGAPGYANETSEARVMRLKGYGNSIVAPLAAMFIETCMEVIPHE
jgi:DNA (cytosine-5)-methyltransferase 1